MVRINTDYNSQFPQQPKEPHGKSSFKIDLEKRNIKKDDPDLESFKSSLANERKTLQQLIDKSSNLTKQDLYKINDILSELEVFRSRIIEHHPELDSLFDKLGKCLFDFRESYTKEHSDKAVDFLRDAVHQMDDFIKSK